MGFGPLGFGPTGFGRMGRPTSAREGIFKMAARFKMAAISRKNVIVDYSNTNYDWVEILRSDTLWP